MRKQKILLLVDWFVPGYKAGGPIQSCLNFALAMRNDYELYILTTDTDHGEMRPYEGIVANTWNTTMVARVQIFYAKKAGLSARLIKDTIDSVDADYIYLNHLFSPYFVVYPLWLKFRNKLKAKIIVCPRGALYNSALSIKWYKKKPFLFLFKLARIPELVLFHATNEREKTAILKHFPSARVQVADNLPAMLQPPLKPYKKEEGSLKCVFIARVVPIKNLLFLLTALQALKAVVKLSIVGPQEDRFYWEDCQAAIAKLPANISTEYLGSVPNNELPDILHQHHLFVLPTTGENFGHAIFEAFVAGRPVLISDQTPWLDLQQKGIGWDLPLSGTNGFTASMESAASWSQQDFDTHSKAAWNFAHNFIHNPGLRTPYFSLFQ